jgi:hypothetical protein
LGLGESELTAESEFSGDRLVQLKSKVKAAQHAYDLAAASFDELNEQVVNRSHGMPHPDGTQAIRNAAIAERAAFAKYRTALQEYLDYVLGRTDLS